MEIPLPPIEQPDIYSYGFDKSLNRGEVIDSPIVYNTFEKNINPSLLQSGTASRFIQLDNAKIGTLKADSLFFTKQFVISYFESTDGWQPSGLVTPMVGGLSMQTTNVSGTTASVGTEPPAGDVDFSNKNPSVYFFVAFSATSNQTAYLSCGTLTTGDGTEEGFGFKISGNTLNAISIQSDGVTSNTTTTAIPGITLTDWNLYRASLDSKNSKIDYYINDELKATIITNLPDGTIPILMEMKITNLEAVNKAIYARFAAFLQDL